MTVLSKKVGAAFQKTDARKLSTLDRMVKEQGDVYVVRLLAGVLRNKMDPESRRLADVLQAAADGVDERRSAAVQLVMGNGDAIR